MYVAEPVTPIFLDWSKFAINYDHSDYPGNVPFLGCYLLVVDPIISNTQLSMVLMDGCSSVNIMYVDTFNAIGLDRSFFHLTGAPFHGIMP